MIGVEVGGFTVRQRLGTGGMGAVYLAFQHSVGRNVALKVMAPTMGGDPTLANRFMREAKLSAQLSSPNIVTTLDFGQTPEGQLFLAMELVEGETLSTAVQRAGPMSWRRAVQLTMQVCEGLSIAHARGIVHRDLKPQNLMVLQQGPSELVKILDFGLARSAGDSRLTSSNMVMGSPNFIAPEIIVGEDGDARSDLYAVGGILYFMLEGRVPYGSVGSATEIMARQLKGASPAVSGAVPPAVSSVLRRLLDVDPNRRPRNAETVRELLAATLELPEPIPGPTAARGRRSVTLAGISFVALAGLAFVLSRWPITTLVQAPVVLPTVVALPVAEPPDAGFAESTRSSGSVVDLPDAAKVKVEPLLRRRVPDAGRFTTTSEPELWDPRNP
jgi:serine/threonine protein kinase